LLLSGLGEGFEVFSETWFTTFSVVSAFSFITKKYLPIPRSFYIQIFLQNGLSFLLLWLVLSKLILIKVRLNFSHRSKWNHGNDLDSLCPHVYFS
jgi:hypothetical protein